MFSQPVGIRHPKWIPYCFERFYEAKNGWYWYFTNMKYLYEVGDIPILMPSKSLKIVWYPHHSESLTIINQNIYTGHVPCWWKSGIRLPGAHGSSAPRLPVPALQGTAPQTEFLTQRHGTIEIHRRYNHECNETDTVINCSLYISSYVYIEIFNIWSISIDIIYYIYICVCYTQ